MRSIIERIATGPEMSKDISREEARAGMQLVLAGRVDPVQAGVFLIALRMKRETDDENRGMADAIAEATRASTCQIDDVMCLADPYDGFNRSLLVSAFLAPVLAACGIPTVSHGARSVGPKFGATHHQVLVAAGISVDRSPEQAAALVSDSAIGWSYVDQAAFCPSLHALLPLRALIVKRPALTTLERLSMPLHGRKRTHLMTGYVHKAYPRVYSLLARHAGFASALIVKGVEGGIVPPLTGASRTWRYVGDDAQTETEISPDAVGVQCASRAVPLPSDLPGYRRKTAKTGATIDAAAMASAAAEAGTAALAGEHGAARDALVYAGALCWQHRNPHESLATAADAVRRALDSGEAAARLSAA